MQKRGIVKRAERRSSERKHRYGGRRYSRPACGQEGDQRQRQSHARRPMRLRTGERARRVGSGGVSSTSLPPCPPVSDGWTYVDGLSLDGEHTVYFHSLQRRVVCLCYVEKVPGDLVLAGLLVRTQVVRERHARRTGDDGREGANRWDAGGREGTGGSCCVGKRGKRGMLSVCG